VSDELQRRWMRRVPWRRRSRVGVPADHFVPAERAVSEAKVKKLVRKELARRRAQRTRRI